MLAPAAIVVVLGALLIALAVPLTRRRVPPNQWYGLRVPATFADEWVWYEANARSGRDMIAFGALFVVVGIALTALPPARRNVAVPLCFAALVLGLIVVAIIGWRRANRLLDERRRGNGER